MDHIEKMTINVPQFDCVLNNIIHNPISFRLKFQDPNYSYKETMSTTITPNLSQKENTSTFTFSNDSEKTFYLDDIFLSMNELRSSQLTLRLNEVRTGEQSSESSHQDSFKMRSSTHKSHGLDIKSLQSEIAYCQVNFYKILSENDNSIMKMTSHMFQQHSHLYAPLIPNSSRDNKQESIKDTSNNAIQEIKFKIFDNIQKSFKEKLIYKGMEIGYVSGKIHVNSIPLIRQILCGVHTENGLDINANYLSINRNLQSSSKELNKLPEKAIRLQNIHDTLVNILLTKTGLEQVSNEVREKGVLISKLLQEALDLMKSSIKESSLFYSYSSEFQLINTQETMLKLGILIINIIESVNVEQRNTILMISEYIHERGEFFLSSVGITHSDSQNEKLKMKVNVAELYISYLNKCLKFCLEKLGTFVVDENIKNFVEFFLSVAYFRIPLVMLS